MSEITTVWFAWVNYSGKVDTYSARAKVRKATLTSVDDRNFGPANGFRSTIERERAYYSEQDALNGLVRKHEAEVRRIQAQYDRAKAALGKVKNAANPGGRS